MATSSSFLEFLAAPLGANNPQIRLGTDRRSRHTYMLPDGFTETLKFTTLPFTPSNYTPLRLTVPARPGEFQLLRHVSGSMFLVKAGPHSLRPFLSLKA